jgi:uroporphyrinogen-III synthase
MRGAVVITASAGTFPGLVDALRAIPVPVEEVPLMDFAPPLDWGPVDRALDRIDEFDAVAVTSPRAARAFASRASARGMVDRFALRHKPVALWAGGPATAEALGKGMGEIHQPSTKSSQRLGAAAALAAAMLKAGVKGPVLFPCGDLRRDELPARLEDDGVHVEDVVCYRSVLASEGAARAAAERARVLIVASPSVADLLARVCPTGGRPLMLAVGPTTAAAARGSGWAPAAVSTRPDAQALAGTVRGLLSSI